MSHEAKDLDEAMTARAAQNLEAANENSDREQLLRDAKTVLCAALDLLELEPATAAALIPKAHRRALKYARSMGDKVVEGEG